MSTAHDASIGGAFTRGADGSDSRHAPTTVNQIVAITLDPKHIEAQRSSIGLTAFKWGAEPFDGTEHRNLPTMYFVLPTEKVPGFMADINEHYLGEQHTRIVPLKPQLT